MDLWFSAPCSCLHWLRESSTLEPAGGECSSPEVSTWWSIACFHLWAFHLAVFPFPTSCDQRSERPPHGCKDCGTGKPQPEAAPNPAAMGSHHSLPWCPRHRENPFSETPGLSQAHQGPCFLGHGLLLASIRKTDILPPRADNVKT